MANLFKLTKDNRGRWRRQNLGRKKGENGMVSATFLLGTDHGEACRRVVLLEQIWSAVEKTWQALKTTEAPIWEEDTYAIALAVARGETDIVVPPRFELDKPMQAGYLADLREEFPFLSLRFSDEKANDNSRQVADHMEEDAAYLLDRARHLKRTVTGTLHQALDAYQAFITEKYAGKANQRPQQHLVALLKGHSHNLPLDKMDADQIDQWLAVWCKRPTGKKGTLALTTCRNVLIALRQFIRWLARSEAFHWEPPKGYMFPRCRIDKTPSDRTRRRQHFNRSELAVIWQYAHSWDRALMLLALNCGFSKREIAILQSSEIVQRKGRMFIKRHRTKSDVYGEWELWPETIQALDYLNRRPNGSPYVVVNQHGTSLINGTKRGNENQVIKNHWDRLMGRVTADHPDFHKLPFKCLRKTGATFIRKLASGEVASMYLAHGEKADHKDQLLSVYTSRPWRKVHKALAKLRSKLLPILTSVPEPWKETAFRKSPMIRTEVLALRQEGKSYQEIATKVGLHPITVGKICRKPTPE